MSRSTLVAALLVTSIVALGAGILLGQKIPLVALIAVALAALAVAIFTKKLSRTIALFVLVAALSLVRTWFLPHAPTAQDVDFWNDDSTDPAVTTLEATICAEPDVRHTQTKYTLCATHLTQGENGRDVTGKVLLTHDRWPAFQYGDEVVVTGVLATPFVSDEFNYERYLARFGVFSEMRYSTVSKVGESTPNWLFAKILQFKDFYARVIGSVLPEPQASFLDGLLRGARKGLPDNIYDEFQKTGLTHIIAVSGFNITIIAAAMMAIFGRISRRFGAIATILGILFFVIFTGMSAAVVRAGLMGGIGALAILTGRQAHATIALLVAAVIMLMWSPLTLFYDVGFQLSFLATLGLIFVSPFFENWTRAIPDFLGFKEAFLLTISAQVTVVPLIAYHFGRLSLISPFANVAVAPFIVFAMATGFLAVLGGMVSRGLGIFLAIPAYLSLSVILAIAHWGAQIGWADVELQMSFAATAIYYLLLTAALLWLWIHHDPHPRPLGQK